MSLSDRGIFTPKIEAFMAGFLKRETSVTELRLIPYLHYVMVNDQKVEVAKINEDERKIMSLLRKDGHIDGGASGLRMTREYWDFCCDVLWKAYATGE